jgi:hypothetical protein
VPLAASYASPTAASPGDRRGEEELMEPVLPDAPVEESEFDLDVRIDAVALEKDPPTPSYTCVASQVCGGC